MSRCGCILILPCRTRRRGLPSENLGATRSELSLRYSPNDLEDEFPEAHIMGECCFQQRPLLLTPLRRRCRNKIIMETARTVPATTLPATPEAADSGLGLDVVVFPSSRFFSVRSILTISCLLVHGIKGAIIL